MNKLANVIMKKDIRLLFKNKRLVFAMCVPLIVSAVVVPTVFVIATNVDSASVHKYSAVFEKLLKVNMNDLTPDTQKRMLVEFLLYNMLPILFMLLPTTLSAVVAANSFIGEKVNGTLETLFFSPIRISDMFIAKVKTSLFLSMGLYAAGFVLMCIVLNILLPLNGFPFFVPNVRWFVVLFVIGLAITILSTTLIIKKSESASSIEEAQGVTLFFVVPIAVLLAVQAVGVILISDLMLVVLGTVLLGVSIAVMKVVSTKVGYRR